MTFRDHFSADSAGYARHRPRYPDALFAWLAAQAPAREHSVDIATGSGQAAAGLAAHFARVSAFDASAAQLRHAEARDNLHYAVATAEAIPLPDAGADLVTVAQALHWLDLEGFYPECRRVLKPGGVLACWTYDLLQVTPAVDARVQHLYRDVLGRWWPYERRHVEDGYARLPFPFRRLAAPAFAMEADWTCEHLLGYLRTWSAWQAYTAAGHPDPVNAIADALRDDFGPGERRVHWPLSLLAGTP